MAELPIDRDRPSNRDPSHKSIDALPCQTGLLFLVADGIGGVPCGERASAMAVRSFCGYLEREFRVLKRGRREISRTLRRGIAQCNSALRAEAERRPECAGMGTTLTGVLCFERRIHIVHSGDSRFYLLRGSELHLVTDDHSRAQLEIDSGTVDREAARTSQGGNSLWKFLTSSAVAAPPDTGSMPLEPGDTLLLCTDGVSDALSEDQINRHLAIRGSAKSICTSLFADARRGAGGDDLTAIVARFGVTA